MVRRFTSVQPYSRFFFISKSSCFFSSQPHAGDVVPSSLSSFSISLSSLGVVLVVVDVGSGKLFTEKNQFNNLLYIKRMMSK